MKIQYRRRFPSLLVAFLAISFARTGHGQSQYLSETGSPPNTSLQPLPMGYVNVGNGNLHIEIPFVSIPQRGGKPFFAKLTYDSRIWTILDNGTSKKWVSNNTFAGWRFVTPYGGYPIMQNVMEGCLVYNPETEMLELKTFYSLRNYRYVDSGGTVRKFALYRAPNGNDCGVGSLTYSGPAVDGSGYMMDMNYTYGTVTRVTAPDGTTVYRATPFVGASGGIWDSNGNYFCKDSAICGSTNDTRICLACQ